MKSGSKSKRRSTVTVKMHKNSSFRYERRSAMTTARYHQLISSRQLLPYQRRQQRSQHLPKYTDNPPTTAL